MRIWRNRLRVLPLAALPFLALLSLPGCSDMPRIFSPAPAPARPTVSPRRTIPALPLPLPPIPPAAKGPPAVPVTSEPLNGPVPPQPAIVVTGLSSPQLLKLFGEPAARVPTGQGERWTYRAGECQLDVFMFPDVSHGGLTVLDHRISDDAAGEQACLRRLRDDHAI